MAVKVGRMKLIDALIESQHCLGRFGKVPEMKNAGKENGFVDLLDEVGPALFKLLRDEWRGNLQHQPALQ